MSAVFHKPRALRPGDPVAIVAPAGPFDRPCFDAGAAALAARYRLQIAPALFDRDRYLAGSDGTRLSELARALADPSVRAIFCARGGYGSMRLLARLSAVAGEGLPRGARDAASADWKPLVGFSDITALHQWCQSRGLVSIHGPVVTQLGRLPASAQNRLFELLESPSPRAPVQATATLVSGAATGPLLGGNLSVFTRLVGTPFLPPLAGAILLLEDVGERPYRLDRMWTHLALAGVFQQIAGIALGSFTECEERDGDYSSLEVLHTLAAESGVPCALGFPIGHGDLNEAVALGARVRLDADARVLEFLEPAVTSRT